MSQPVSNFGPIKLFYSYSRNDETYLEELVKRIVPLRRSYSLAEWDDRMIIAGDKWEEHILQNLEAAHIILLLISPDFIASEFCYRVEMSRALARESRGEASVIPIILRPCGWRETPLARLQALPRNGQAVTSWKDFDEACQDIYEGIRNAIMKIQAVTLGNNKRISEDSSVNQGNKTDKDVPECTSKDANENTRNARIGGASDRTKAAASSPTSSSDTRLTRPDPFSSPNVGIFGTRTGRWFAR